MPVLAAAPALPSALNALPSALNALPTAAAVAALCVAVIVEIIVVPAVLLPGGTMTLLAAHHRPGVVRALTRRTVARKRRLSSTML